MAVKVGATTVIDDSGNINWGRITGAPSFGTGDITAVNINKPGPSGGAPFRNLFGNPGNDPGQNYACFTNCYVSTLSGGAASGAATVSGNRASFNCNCNCQCRC